MSRREIGGYITTFLFAVLLYAVLNVIIRYSYNAARNFHNKRKQAKGRVSSIDSYSSGFSQKGGQSADENRKAKEEKYWLITQWAAVFGSMGAVVAAFLAFGAFYQARRQAAAAEEANRPWLYIDRVDASKIIIEDNAMMHAVVDVYISNLRHSVATDIQIDAALALEPAMYASEIEAFCTGSEIDDFLEFQNGRTAFPEKPSVIAAATPNLQINRKTDLNLIELRLCLHYRTSRSGAEHRTGTFFVLKNLKIEMPGETKDVPTVQDFLAGAYAD